MLPEPLWPSIEFSWAGLIRADLYSVVSWTQNKKNLTSSRLWKHLSGPSHVTALQKMGFLPSASPVVASGEQASLLSLPLLSALPSPSASHRHCQLWGKFSSLSLWEDRSLLMVLPPELFFPTSSLTLCKVHGGREAGVSAVKSTGCSCGGLRFESQHPQGGSQVSVTLVPRNPTPSSGFYRYCTHMVTYVQEKHPYM